MFVVGEISTEMRDIFSFVRLIVLCLLLYLLCAYVFRKQSTEKTGQVIVRIKQPQIVRNGIIVICLAIAAMFVWFCYLWAQNADRTYLPAGKIRGLLWALIYPVCSTTRPRGIFENGIMLSHIFQPVQWADIVGYLRNGDSSISFSVRNSAGQTEQQTLLHRAAQAAEIDAVLARRVQTT